MHLTRQSYDNFINSIRAGLAAIKNTYKSSAISLKRTLRLERDDMGGVIVREKIKFEDAQWFLLILGTLCFGMIYLIILAFGLGDLLDTFINPWIIAIFAIILSIATPYCLIRTYLRAWEGKPFIHWWWLMFAHRIDLYKVFGYNHLQVEDDDFSKRLQAKAYLNDIDEWVLYEKFLLSREPHLGLWYIHVMREEAFFLRKSDLFYLKFKYYNQYLGDDFKKIVSEINNAKESE